MFPLWIFLPQWRKSLFKKFFKKGRHFSINNGNTLNIIVIISNYENGFFAEGKSTLKDFENNV